MCEAQNAKLMLLPGSSFLAAVISGHFVQRVPRLRVWSGEYLELELLHSCCGWIECVLWMAFISPNSGEVAVCHLV